MGDVFRLEKRLPESRESYERGIAILVAAWGPDDWRLLTWLDNYASVLRAVAEYTKAERSHCKPPESGLSKRDAVRVEPCAAIA